MTLSLKYRAKTFDEIAGNEKTVNDLRNRSKKQHFSKVVLFTGVSGSGKTTLTRIYTKSLLCKDIDENGNPCNKCTYCNIVDTEINTEYINFYDGGSFGVKEAEQVKELTSKKILGNRDQKKILGEKEELRKYWEWKEDLKIFKFINVESIILNKE